MSVFKDSKEFCTLGSFISLSSLTVNSGPYICLCVPQLTKFSQDFLYCLSENNILSLKLVFLCFTEIRSPIIYDKMQSNAHGDTSVTDTNQKEALDPSSI